MEPDRSIELVDNGGDFEALIEFYRAKIAEIGGDYVVLTQADCLRRLRAGLLAARLCRAAAHVLMPCDIDGRTPSGVDVLAAWVVAQGMGVSADSFYLDGEAAGEHIGRLSSYIADMHMLAATATEAFLIDPTISVGEPITCGAHFPEELLAAEDSAGAVYVIIADRDDLDAFAEHQYMIRNPLCIGAESAELLEAALRLYDGRPFYDGRDTVVAADLNRLTREYGLLVL
ncbi:hypothetical protein FACS18949_12540 [Clostridia bacterium]|nr:hypothetical protein FACS18949_12540 [Clostridia bacterium]